MGVGTSRGTKVLSLNSLFRRPGLVEVELGTPMRTVIEELGGGLEQGRPWGVILGGPLAGILPPAHFDAPLALDELRVLGATVGHGGLVALDDRTTVRELLHHVFDFGAFESCGKCTPCRLGAPSIASAMAPSGSGTRFDEGDFETWWKRSGARASVDTAPGSAELATSVLRYYREELRACFA